MNECTGTNNCDENAVCTNTPGSFNCTCASGYAGNGVTCAYTPITVANTQIGSPTRTSALTIVHPLTSGLGAARVVVVGVIAQTTALTVTYEDVPMLLAANAGASWIYYLGDSGLPTIPASYVVSLTASDGAVQSANVVELIGVDAQYPLDTTTYSQRADSSCAMQSDTLTVLTNDSFLYGVATFSTAATVGTGTSGQTVTLGRRGTPTGMAGYLNPVAAGSQSFGWLLSTSCTNSAGVVAAFKPAAKK